MFLKHNTKTRNTNTQNTKQTQNDKTILEHIIRQTQSNLKIFKQTDNTKHKKNSIKTHSINTTTIKHMFFKTIKIFKHKIRNKANTRY